MVVDIFGFRFFSEKEVNKKLNDASSEMRPERGLGTSDFKAFEYRYDNVFMAVLYDYAYYSDTYRTILNALVREIFRNGSEFKPKFVKKCTGKKCGKEFEYDTDECDECHSMTRNPATMQKKKGEEFFSNVNLNMQTLIDVAEECEQDLDIVDNAYMIMIKKYYYNREGAIIAADPVEIIRGDPLVMRKIIDRFGRLGYDQTTSNPVRVCPEHRGTNQGSKEVCEQCGKKTYPAHYMTFNASNTVYYIDKEVCHKTKYTKTLFYGFPPMLSVMYKVRTLLAMDNYCYQYYGGQKAPKGVLLINTSNMASLKKGWDEFITKVKSDPHSLYPFMMPKDTSGEKSDAQYIDLMRSLQDMSYIEAREEYRTSIGALFGVSPIFQSDTKGGGGLNNEGLQITVTTRALESGQNVYSKGFFPWITNQLGITDWEYVLKPVEQKDEAADLQLEGAKIANAQAMKNLGYKVDRTDEGEFKFEKMEQNPMQGTVNNPEDIPPIDTDFIKRVEGEPQSLHKSGDLKKSEISDEEAHKLKGMIYGKNFEGMDKKQSEKVRKIIVKSIMGEGSLQEASAEMQKAGVDKAQADAIVRTEEHNIKTILREGWYRAMDKTGKAIYRWIGPSDSRTTPYCKEIMKKTLKGVSLDELKKIIREHGEKDTYKEDRPYQPHINCRHTFVKVIKG